MSNYPIPGRGAWTLSGGLLTAKPGQNSKRGYYRNAVASEVSVGSSWLTDDESPASHPQYCVHLGVVAIQELVGADPDGWFGRETAAKVVAAQQKAGVEADGIVGATSMKAFLTPLISDIAGHTQVPVSILGGLLVNESGLDPAAVGVNGEDHGLAQINMAAHGSQMSLEQALDPGFAIHWSAEELYMAMLKWQSGRVDPWTIAIANHNSPALARKWALSGVAPVVEGRVFQIADYVAKVRTAW